MSSVPIVMFERKVVIAVREEHCHSIHFLNQQSFFSVPSLSMHCGLAQLIADVIEAHSLGHHVAQCAPGCSPLYRYLRLNVALEQRS